MEQDGSNLLSYSPFISAYQNNKKDSHKLADHAPCSSCTKRYRLDITKVDMKHTELVTNLHSVEFKSGKNFEKCSASKAVLVRQMERASPLIVLSLSSAPVSSPSILMMLSISS